MEPTKSLLVDNRTWVLFDEAEEKIAAERKRAEEAVKLKENAEHDLADVLDAIKRHEQETRYHHYGSPAQRIDAVIREYQDAATKSIARSKHFRDDVLITLRALALVADMVGSASTHAEKGARLRGLIELLEGSIRRLQEVDFDLTNAAWRLGYESVFQSDYPTRQFMLRIRDLEQELARYQKAEGKGEPQPEEIPF